jgi:hypothetical protein
MGRYEQSVLDMPIKRNKNKHAHATRGVAKALTGMARKRSSRLCCILSMCQGMACKLANQK